MLYVVLALVVILGGIAVLASRKPDMFAVTREAVIPATPETVFPYINNMHKWNEWSPWARAEPDAKLLYEGPAEGVGAAFSWAGRKVGAGKMTVVQATPAQLVVVRLDFERPFKATNEAWFSLRAEGDATHMAWSMTGRNTFMAKIMSVFMDCEKMCGDQFNQGFENLKQLLSRA